MLNLIQQSIGGRVRIDKDQFILWLVDSRKTIKEIITIFEKYPPLTTRLNLQIKFMKECLSRNNVD
jgi:LAGLIDADG endonuclease